MPCPIFQPIGPMMACAAIIVGIRANNGTKIIETASGYISGRISLSKRVETGSPWQE
jgi:hypothetical protein